MNILLIFYCNDLWITFRIVSSDIGFRTQISLFCLFIDFRSNWIKAFMLLFIAHKSFSYLPFIAVSPEFITSVAVWFTESTSPPGPPPFTSGELLAQPMTCNLYQQLFSLRTLRAFHLTFTLFFIYFHKAIYFGLKQLISSEPKLNPAKHRKTFVNKLIEL